MKVGLAFLIIGFLVYILAGIATLIQVGYSAIFLAISIIFLAIGLYANVRTKISKSVGNN